jgi:hypothetical protein
MNFFDGISRTGDAMNLKIRPLPPDLWPAIEDLFGRNDACKGCWCMYGRIGSAYRSRPGEKNKEAFWEVVKRGPAPGLVAFMGEFAAGWCQLTPRDAVPWAGSMVAAQARR